MKWGIIGAGTIAKKFADTVNKMEGESLVAVGSRTLDKAESFAKEYGAPFFYGSYEELANSSEIDAVYIATPNSMHFENSMLCLNAGKHVLCEKPFTLRAEDAEKLYKTAEEKGLFIMEGFWIWFLPLYKKLREIVDSKVFGEIVHVRTEYGFVAKGARRTRKFESSLGGGALLDIGIYNLGFIQMVTGDYPETFSSEVRFNELATDEYSLIQYRYEDGKTANALTSIGYNIPRHAAIMFEHGQIYLDDFQHAESMTVIPENGEKYIIEDEFEISGFEYEIREVSRCVEAGLSHSDFYTPDDNLSILSQMDEIRDVWGMKFECEE